MDALKVKQKVLQTIADLQQKVKVMDGLKIGSLYHVEISVPSYKVVKGTWQVNRSNGHMLGRLTGYRYVQYSNHISAAFQMLTSTIDRESRKVTKTGERTRTVCIPPAFVGEDAEIEKQGQVVLDMREVSQDDLLVYVGDPNITPTFKKYLSGDARPRKKKTTKFEDVMQCLKSISG